MRFGWELSESFLLSGMFCSVREIEWITHWVVMKIFMEVAKLEQQNRPFAMAQIIESRCSTPRHSVQILVLYDGSVISTIGGGW
ncbi:hypothetical protein ARAF_2002 [Arsenophonus endosymbiont of Aleurodicus floccissimus]|nr:hypothetical protein ARAF_2002 [Arsenophonus endosymbiont of Aleurodicus floccissimus]